MGTSDDPAVSPSGLAETAQAPARAEAPPPLEPGSQIHRYQVTAQLGAGGMGVVYRAWDGALKRMVALKLIRSRHGDAGVQSRFEREAQAMAQLSHRNVVGVHDFGVHEGQPYLVMELIEGGSLRAYLSKPERTWRERVDALISAARGLDAAHAAGIVHRDFKPENVLVGDDGRIAVTDFGLARSFDETKLEAPVPGGGGGALQLGVTNAQTVLGTPLYMAPEQYLAQQTDARTDVFSFGVVLYEALYGVRPFPSSGAAAPVTLDEMRADVMSGRTRTPPSLRGSPQAIFDLIVRCLRPDPAQRPQTLGEVIAALEQSLAPPAWPKWLAVAALAVLAGAGTFWWNTRLPAGQSPVPAAQRAFDEGMAQLRGGSDPRARASFAAALKEDPAFATAAVWAAYLESDSTHGRALLALARDHRDRLDARGLVFLEALGPGAMPMPNVKEWLGQLEALVAAHPAQAELRLLRAETLNRIGDYDRALAELAGVALLEPAFAARIAAMRGMVESFRLRPDAALAEFDQCLATAPDAIDCLAGRAHTLSNRGDCVGMERDARRWAALDPENPQALEELAFALHATGAPWPSVLETLKRRRAKTQARLEWFDAFRVEAIQGHLAEARDLAKKAAEDPALPPTLLAHVTPTLQWVLALRENDEAEAMAAVSEDFLARSAAWTADASRDVALAQMMVGTAYHAGKVDRAQFEARRAAAVETMEKAAAAEGMGRDAYVHNLIWVAGWAAITQSAEEAGEALAALPRYLPLPPPGTRGLDTSLVIGANFLWAGRAAEAAPYLEAAARSCRKLENPVGSVLALYWVGRVRAELGDPAGARAAYTAFLAAWPNTRRSPEVKERLAALPTPAREAGFPRSVPSPAAPPP